MTTPMIRMALFAFDEDKKMIGRIQAETLVHVDDFDPEWVKPDEIRKAFTEELNVKAPYPQHCFALIENVKYVKPVTTEPTAA